MTNSEVAALLEQLGDLLEIEGEDGFKVRAYQRAAQALEGLHEPVERLLKEGRLTEVPGIGKAIGAKIQDILTTGTTPHLERLREKVPEGVVAMLRIPGLGPRKAGVFYRTLGVASVEELRIAAHEGRIRDLPGMGKKTEDNILASITGAGERLDRVPIGDARPYADAMADALRSIPGVLEIEVAGSLRRWRDMVKDVDLVAASEDPGPLMDAFASLPQVQQVLLRGDTKTSVMTGLGVQADLRVVPPSHFGSLLAHFTGSKAHNVRLRSIANARGLRINEYGVFTDPGGELVPVENERGLYELLEMDYVPPELREDTGEVEAAQGRRLHRPLEASDIRCDLHCHTTYSDGTGSLEEMAEAGRALGYTHLGIADHSRSLVIAHGCTVERIREQIRAIRAWNDRNGSDQFRLLAGSECDILGDGSLDWPDDIIGELDFLVASVHSRMKMDEKSMTDRIVRALETGKVSILGHPTGRRLGSREPYPLDFERVFEAARRTGACVEIDGHPQRVDLSDLHARVAKDLGIRIAVDSDGHSVEGMKNIRFGVHCARRAWLTSEHVVNTYPVDRLLRVFRREE